MALHEMCFEFAPKGEFRTIPKNWSHTGVVGSGDMEVLLTRTEQDGKVTIRVKTPVRGFDEIWEKVLGRFVEESGIGNVLFEINDNNATPYIVAARLKQALAEAEGEEDHSRNPAALGSPKLEKGMV